MIKKGFFTRLAISSLSLGVADALVDGIYVNTLTTLIIAAFLMGIINAVVRPLFIILTFPITIITLGFFLLVLNALLLALVAALIPGFYINSLSAAFWGWLIISLTSWLTSKIFIDKDECCRR